MAIPEGYEKLAVVGMAWKGVYAAGTAYKEMNTVYYKNSTYVALRDNPTGPPAADGTNWQYLAKGFVAALLSMVTAKDTSGLVGTAGADVGAQDLMDAIANKMVTELVSNTALAEKLAGYLLKSQVVNNLLATVPGNVLDAMQGKALGDAVTKVNRDLDGKIPYYSYQVPATDDVDSAIKAGLTSAGQTTAFVLRLYITATGVFLFTVGCESGVYTAYGVLEGNTSTMLQTVVYEPGVDYKRSVLPST